MIKHRDLRIDGRILRETLVSCVHVRVSCVRGTQAQRSGAVALRYCDVLVLSSTHLNSLKLEIQRRINRRDVNRDVKYAPLHAERGSLSHPLLSPSSHLPPLSLSLPFSHVTYIILPMLPGALSLSSRLRLPRERNRILSFNSTISPLPPPYRPSSSIPHTSLRVSR